MRSGLLFLALGSLLAQTNLTPPVTVLPTSGRSATGQLLFRDQQTSYHSVGFQAAASIPANVVWTLPTADNTGCLISDGARHLSFADCAGALGGSSPYGSFAELQNYLLNS